MTPEQIAHVFTYHKPKEGQPQKYEDIRTAGATLAHVILLNCPVCVEREVAIERIREAVMWANAAIACNE